MLKLLFAVILLTVVVSGQKSQKKFADHFQQHEYKMKFDHIEMFRFNKEAINRFPVVTYKYNRTCAVSNFTWNYKIDIGKNLQVIIQAYKFMSNEYRVFPLRFEINFCAAIDGNLIGGGKFMKCGNFTQCYIGKGITYHVCNWAPDQYKFPPLIPSGKYMVEVQGLYMSREMFVMHGFGEIVYDIVWK